MGGRLMAELLAIQRTYIAMHKQVLDGRLPKHWPSDVLAFTTKKLNKMLEVDNVDGFAIIFDGLSAYLQVSQHDEEQDSEGDEEA
jgi:hypothetical protein